MREASPMFFFFFPFGGRGYRGNRRYYRRRSFGFIPFLLMLGFLSMLFSQPNGNGLVLFFFIAPLLFFFMISSIISSVFRRLAERSMEVENYWSGHLSKDVESDIDPESLPADRESSEPREEEPPAVHRDERLSQIWKRAQGLRYEPGLNRLARNAQRQSHALAELHERFQQLLANKLRPDELTYRRFLASAAQGHQMIANEIEEAVSRLEYLQSVGTSLRAASGDAPDDSGRYHDIEQEQLSKISALLSRTQDAVAQFARVNFAIVEMRGTSSRKAEDINSAIDQLKDLAQRAQHL
ncbi:MAG: hypothetical protein ACJ763_09065 [Bdellovibrionia bacterium]